jgi:hypothetical protein
MTVEGHGGVPSARALGSACWRVIDARGRWGGVPEDGPDSDTVRYGSIVHEMWYSDGLVLVGAIRDAEEAERRAVISCVCAS